MRNMIACSILAVGLAWAQHSIAAERMPPLIIPNEPSQIPDGQPVPLHPCATMESMKAAFKGAKFTQLNAGQLHYMQGVYSGTPPVGPPPPADSAFLVQTKKKSMVVWMKGTPGCLFGAPMQIPEPMAAMVKGINPGKGEIADPYSDDSQDLHL